MSGQRHTGYRIESQAGLLVAVFNLVSPRTMITKALGGDDIVSRTYEDSYTPQELKEEIDSMEKMGLDTEMYQRAYWELDRRRNGRHAP